MNGKRILVRLIWLFVAINLILFVTNSALKYKEYRVSNKRLEAITDVLEEQGITMECELPDTYAPLMPAELSFDGSSARYKVEKNFFGSDLVSVKHSVGRSRNSSDNEAKAQYCSFNKEVLAFDGNVIYYENQGIEKGKLPQSGESAKRFCDELIKRIEPERKMTYRVEQEIKEDCWRLTYYMTLNDMPVWEGYMAFEVCQDGVASAEIYLADLSVISQEKKAIYPVDSVLFGLKDELEARRAKKITNVELVYVSAEADEDMWGHEIVPAYKITVDGLAEDLFVNAYTNEMLN